MPIDTDSYGADVLVCSGYKWLGGHGGVGLAAISSEVLKEDPVMAGWMGASNPFDMQPKKLLYAEDARKFTQSTMSYISIKGLETAIKEIIKYRKDEGIVLEKDFIKRINKIKELLLTVEEIDSSRIEHILSLIHI